jgi:LysR family transcriptional regulator of gallate degradation
MDTISLRQARVFLAVADCEGVTRAAKVLNRSQTSVTKSLHDLERQIGEQLFDRNPNGVSMTAFGHCLLASAREAADAFAAAGELAAPAVTHPSTSLDRFFRMDVSDRWLDAFLALVEHQSVSAAAEHIGLTPAAVSSSLRKLEDTLGTSLFKRTPRAIVPTSFGLELSRLVKLARAHLRNACDEMSRLRGISRGRLVIGTLPLVRTIIAPKAITQLLARYSCIDIATVEGPYDDLVAGLRNGDIDLMLGALRGSALDKDLEEEVIFEDSLSVIVRADHPLLGGPRLQWQDLLRFQWILPRQGTPTRKLFDQALRARGLPLPQHVVETSSLVMLRGLLMESDRVTVLSRHQIRFDEQGGLLAALPFQLRGTERPIGMTRRKSGTLSPATTLFMEEVRTAAAELMSDRQDVDSNALWYREIFA